MIAQEIYGIVPVDSRKSYDVREIIARTVDGSDLMNSKHCMAPHWCVDLHVSLVIQWALSPTTAFYLVNLRRKVRTLLSSALNARFHWYFYKISPDLWLESNLRMMALQSMAPRW